MPMFNLALTQTAVAPPPMHNSLSKAFHSTVIAVTGLLIASIPGFGQPPQGARGLTVAGYTGTAPVIQAGGKSYVSIEDLARLTQGSLSFKADQIILTPSIPHNDAPPAPPAVKQGFSRGFLTSAIEAMSVLREL